jgi:hypothetical protein
VLVHIRQLPLCHAHLCQSSRRLCHGSRSLCLSSR